MDEADQIVFAGNSLLQPSLNKPSVAPAMSKHGSQHDHPAECARTELCPLNKVRPGSCVRIKQLNASDDVNSQLREMGLCEDQEIKLLLTHGSIVCQVCNARLGLNPRLAEHILVEPVAA